MDAFFKKNNTILRMRRSLPEFSHEKEHALYHLLEFYFFPLTRLGYHPRTTRSFAYKLPTAFPFLDLMLEHFGTGPEHWSPLCMHLLYGSLSMNQTRHKWPLIFVFLSLDNACITWEAVTRISQMFPRGCENMLLRDDSLKKWLPNAPESINIGADVIDRIPEDVVLNIFQIATYIKIFPNARPPRCVLTRLLTFLPSEPTGDDPVTWRRDISPILTGILYADTTLASLIPDEFEHQITFQPSLIESFFLDFDTYDDPFDEELASSLAFLTHPDCLEPICEYLKDIKAKHQMMLATELTTFYEKYPGQEPETHECPKPDEHHVCNFDDHHNTCTHCCMNCAFDHRFEVYGVKQHRAFVSACIRLLCHFHKPNMAKRA